MIFSWFGAVALAGSIFGTTLTGDLYEFNTRTLGSTYRAGGMGIAGLSGAAYDSDHNDIWVYTYAYPIDALFRVDASTWTVYYEGRQGLSQDALAYNPVSQSLVTVGHVGVMSLTPFAPYVTLANTGLQTSSADWFDDGGYIVSIEDSTANFYAINPPLAPLLLNPWNAPHRTNTNGLAYDSDTHTFWGFQSGGCDSRVDQAAGRTSCA